MKAQERAFRLMEFIAQRQPSQQRKISLCPPCALWELIFSSSSNHPPCATMRDIQISPHSCVVGYIGKELSFKFKEYRTETAEQTEENSLCPPFALWEINFFIVQQSSTTGDYAGHASLAKFRCCR